MSKLPKDIEPMFGLWVLFELKKCSKEYQIEIINDIKNGNYPKKEKVMNKIIYKTWEDIYPLTLINMRYGGKYVAFNAEEDSKFVQNVNTENVSYELEDWLYREVVCPYGVGNTIMEAMNNLLDKMSKKYNKEL